MSLSYKCFSKPVPITGYADCISIVDKNGAPESQVLECSDLNTIQRPSLSHSIALKMQYSTACDWLAKSCDSILDMSHSYASGLTVTLSRIFRVPLGILGILCEYMPNKLNKNHVVWQISANNALGLNNHDREQPISERYVRQLLRRHPEASGDRGDAHGPEDRDGAFTEPPGEDQACDHGYDGVLHGLRGGGGQLRQVPPLTEACP